MLLLGKKLARAEFCAEFSVIGCIVVAQYPAPCVPQIKSFLLDFLP